MLRPTTHPARGLWGGDIALKGAEEKSDPGGLTKKQPPFADAIAGAHVRGQPPLSFTRQAV